MACLQSFVWMLILFVKLSRTRVSYESTDDEVEYASSYEEDDNNNGWLSKFEKWRSIIKGVTDITKDNNLTPEIKLHLATENAIRRVSKNNSVGNPFPNTPFFTIYWPGGQGLARYILDNPLIVRGLRVLDIGCGSGAVAIAAFKAGASLVTANDIDPIACVATDMNAKLNKALIKVSSENLLEKKPAEVAEQWDCILAGDFIYEDEVLETALPWMARFSRIKNRAIYVGDPGRANDSIVDKYVQLLPLKVYRKLSNFTMKLNLGTDSTSVFKLKSIKRKRKKKIEKEITTEYRFY